MINYILSHVLQFKQAKGLGFRVSIDFIANE